MKDVVVVALDHAPVTRSCLTKTLCVSSKHSNSHQPPGGGSSLTGTHDWREIIRNMLSSSSFNKHTKQTEKSIKTDQNSTFKTMKEAKMKSVRRLFLYCGLINWQVRSSDSWEGFGLEFKRSTLPAPTRSSRPDVDPGQQERLDPWAGLGRPLCYSR